MGGLEHAERIAGRLLRAAEDELLQSSPVFGRSRQSAQQFAGRRKGYRLTWLEAGDPKHGRTDRPVERLGEQA